MKLKRLCAYTIAGMAPLVPAHGAWVIQPSVETRVSYDDNVRLTLDEFKDGGSVNTATVKARVANVSETTSVAGVFGVSFVDYSGTDQTEDSDNQFAQFIVEKNYQRGSIGGTLSANRDSVLRWSTILSDPFNAQDETDLDAELSDLANNVDDVDRTVVREQLERTRIQVSPRAAYTINELTQLVVNYQYYHMSYDDERLATQFGAQDTNSQALSVGLRRGLNERTTVELNMRATDFDPDRTEGSSAYEADIGLRRQFSERTSVRLAVGGTRVSPDGAGDDDNGFSGRLDVNHATADGRLRLTLRRTIYPSSFGTMLESDTLQVSYRHQFSPRLAASIRTQGISSKSSERNSSQNRDFVQLTPEVFWAVSENWQLSAGYQYTWNERDVENDDASSNSVFLSLKYAPRTEVR